MTVLLGEAVADLVSERPIPAAEAGGAENAFKPCERMIVGYGATLEQVVTVLAFDDHGIALVRRLARLAKVALKFGETHLHGSQII
jgi:hypothetical protein